MREKILKQAQRCLIAAMGYDKTNWLNVLGQAAFTLPARIFPKRAMYGVSLRSLHNVAAKKKEQLWTLEG